MKSNSFFKHFIIDINIFWSGNTNSTACHLGRRMDSGSVTHNPKSRLTKDHFSPNFSAENFNMNLFLIICIITCILVCRPYTWRPYILLYAGHIYSYMSVLHTLICRSYILLNVSPLYSNMSMLYTVICQLPTLSYSDMPPYILFHAGVFSVIWSYIGEEDIVIHEFTQLILFEWPIKTPFYFYCWIHFILKLSIYDYD
jgi:hypothetical protein